MFPWNSYAHLKRKSSLVFPAPPIFYSSVCIQHNTWKSGKKKKAGKVWKHLSHDMDVRWIYCRYMCNKPKSKFLSGEEEYSRSCECIVSCLATERSMMKSSTLFECEPLHPYTLLLPDIIHMISPPKPSPFLGVFFALFRLRTCTQLEKKTKKTWKAWNEASTNLFRLISLCG